MLSSLLFARDIFLYLLILNEIISRPDQNQDEISREM